MWEKSHVVLLKNLRLAKKLDWSRAVIDSSHVRAVLLDGQGIPLSVSPTDGNRNDVTQLLPPLDKVPPVPGRSAARGGPVRTRGITPMIIAWPHGFRRQRIR
ncbi:hypothetical protein HCJ76_31745 [Streptomyces sp. MC1]|nr:hypothetical protein [Streptomyces sp. MC1]